MPTKKECKKAINRIQEECDYLSETFHRHSAWVIKKSCKVFEELIKEQEHYKNPLSYKELTVGGPVFDNHTKSWLIVIKKNQIHATGRYPTFHAFHGEELHFEEMEFEKGRYFRKEIIE